MSRGKPASGPAKSAGGVDDRFTPVRAVWLRTNHRGALEVLIELASSRRRWVKVIEDRGAAVHGVISHIVEPAGMRLAAALQSARPRTTVRRGGLKQ